MKEEKKSYHGHRRRLRQRFEKAGLDAFHDYEAVELLLTLAIPRRDVKQQAKEAIKRFGSFRGVLDAPVEELRRIPNMGEVAPIAIRFIKEAANRYLQPQAQGDLSLRQSKPDVVSLDQPNLLLDHCRAIIGPEPNEVFLVIYLDSRFRVIDRETVAKGTIDRATIYPRQVMANALRKGASSLVFTHNHPNGDVKPSDHDKTVTRAVVLAAKTLDITVLDHIIVSRDEAFSFRKEGLL
ncbi:DNA repair protein RadC [Dehalococcoidia bacterium]|nr:DNA repair protein RadC [Dehalococcoidia bacterium]MCL0064620.1 DNA repair protein RadC [Dehalococcoidia bacterium]MCL0095862.1 DNA repair protein RadC [Dehalococcoidia bacterium]MCL0102853.1 DNA repair protein RadC [Dehalococcoidia bacterium]